MLGAKMSVISGQCHCGAVSWALNDRPGWLVSCTCSLCHRYGTLWGHSTQANVTILAEPGASRAYVHGDGMINFHHCTTCGCLTHYSSRPGGAPTDRVSVNMRMAGRDVVAGFDIRTFDGADTWEYLE